MNDKKRIEELRKAIRIYHAGYEEIGEFLMREKRKEELICPGDVMHMLAEMESRLITSVDPRVWRDVNRGANPIWGPSQSDFADAEDKVLKSILSDESEIVYFPTGEIKLTKKGRETLAERGLEEGDFDPKAYREEIVDEMSEL